MPSPSILFDQFDDRPEQDVVDEPDYFHDLNLDQVVASVTAGRDEYDLAPYFRQPLRSAGAVAYRHDVWRDLDAASCLESIRSFGRQMRTMRQQRRLAAKRGYRYQQEAWFLDAADTYCIAVQGLAEDLAQAEMTSRGLVDLRDYVARYVESAAFTKLVTDIGSRRTELATVRYCLNITGGRIRVTRYNGEVDYSELVEKTFEKFRQGAVKDYLVAFRDPAEINHVEAAVLDLVARLYPDVFAALDEFRQHHADYLDATVARFDRESQFYLAYLDYIAPLKKAGLAFCYPTVSASKHISVDATFDLALAAKIVPEGSTVVCNNLRLTGRERTLVVSGPNQGGKTTFARTFGQLHHLAALGCPVPGRKAALFLFDQLFTHFEKEEALEDLRGKLEDELIRIREILDQVTPDSIVIMNEIFTSTTLDDARFLGSRVLNRISELDLLCVCVTFVEELASLNDKVVSMVSTVDPADPASRTFKIVRRDADGSTYAEAIARKHGLTYDLLRERLGR